MPQLDLQPVFLGEQESKEVASRQLLSFLILDSEAEELRGSLGGETGPDEALFSFKALPKDAFTEGPALFNWTSRKIYDVDGLLLFRDQTINLGLGNELHVRIAGSDLLRTPVWTVSAGPAFDIEGLITKALSVIREKTDLDPLFVENEQTVRLVCYSYPKLGILCRSRSDPAVKFVFDLWDLVSIPVHSSEQHPPPESVLTVWSPYDMVVPATLGHFRSLWEQNMALLPALPDRVEGLRDAIELARKGIVQVMTKPRLIRVGQSTNARCAAATARMILQQHGFPKSEAVIADAMDINANGATPVNQVNAIHSLTEGRFLAKLDKDPSFSEAKDEIRKNCPFKTGGAAHARACGGFKIEKEDKDKIEEEGKEWLYIYDPLPANQGKIYYEAWDADYHVNYMYVRPK